jgi:beta-lactamase class D
MKTMKQIFTFCFWMAVLMIGGPSFAGMTKQLDQQSIQSAFGGWKGVFCIVDCETGEVYDSDPALSSVSHAPCSTFKIWNALVGLELGLLKDPEEPFYQWDGVVRFVPAWNQDLNLRDAFQESCVPAFQELARKIGNERMIQWMEKLEYGDRDISAGIDQFWLPDEGRKTILISPREQIGLLRKLATGELPVSAGTVEKLKVLMQVRGSAGAVLYGKTGSSSHAQLGWFVGILNVSDKQYAFACLIQGEGASGRVARGIVEKIFEEQDVF